MFGGFEILVTITPGLTRSRSSQRSPPSPSRRSCSQAIGEQRTSSPQCQRIGRVEGLGSGEVWIGRERGGAMKLGRDGLVCRSRIHVSLGNSKKEGLHTCAYSVKLSSVSGHQRVWKSSLEAKCVNIPVCYVIFATLHPIYILNLVSEMLSTLKCKELNFGDIIKPKPRGFPVLIHHNNHIYSFGGVDMDMKCLQEIWELDLSSRRWINCELHTKTHAYLR